MKSHGLFRTALIVITTAALVYLASVLWHIAGLLFDLLLAMFLAWIIATNILNLIEAIQARTRLRFSLAAALAYLIVLTPILLFVIVIVPLAIGQAAQLSRALPGLLEDVPRLLSSLQGLADGLGIDVDLATVYPQDFVTQATTAIGDWLRGNAFDLAQRTMGAFFQVLVIVSLSVFIVFEEGILGETFSRILPRGWLEDAGFVYRTMASVFRTWLRNVLIIGSIFGIVTFALMTILGLPYAVTISALGGFLVIIPFLGDFIAIGLPIFVALSLGAFDKAIIVGAALAAIDFIVINMFISPRLMAHSFRLPATFIILAALLGAQVVGPWGAFWGVPVVALVYSATIASTDRVQGRTGEMFGAETRSDLGSQDPKESD